MIVILDYEMGNVGSIQNMLRKLGVREALISRDADLISRADHLILPGVGSFDAGMERLQKYDLVQHIRVHALEKRKPLLGICLGMQLLGNRSEEGTVSGLGLIPFFCKRFTLPAESNLKIPHMGWDRTVIKADTPLTVELEKRQRYYFVHSYHAVCEKAENVLMTCEYGYEFPSAVYSDNIYGVQFHPEKSHQYGMKLLQNFIERC